MRGTDRPLTAWTVTAGGYSLGRYRITTLEPRRWQLEVAGRRHSEHPRASEALAKARQVEQVQRRNRSILRNLMVAALALAAFLILLPIRTVANDAYPPARAFVERLETLYVSVRSGEVTVMDAGDLDDEFAGASFTVTSPLTLGEEPVTRYHEMLVGSHSGDCYVIRWQPDWGPTVGVLVPDRPCKPADELTQLNLYVRYRSELTPESEIRWDAVLPPAETQARWFIPAVFAVMILVLKGLVGVTLALIRYARPRVLLPDLPPSGLSSRSSASMSTTSPRSPEP